MVRVLWWIVPAFLLGAGLFELVLVIRGDTEPDTLAFVAILVMLLGIGLAALSIPFARPVRAIAPFQRPDETSRHNFFCGLH